MKFIRCLFYDYNPSHLKMQEGIKKYLPLIFAILNEQMHFSTVLIYVVKKTKLDMSLQVQVRFMKSWFCSAPLWRTALNSPSLALDKRSGLSLRFAYVLRFYQ